MSAKLAIALVAIDPTGFGGVALRGPASPVRDDVIAFFKTLVPATTPFRRMPPSITDDRLIGGLDLALTLATGRAVAMRGLLSECDGGFVIAPMAERMPQSLASRLSVAMDLHEVRAEREGMSLREEARFGVIALDEGLEDEHIPQGLAERLAFHALLDQDADVDLSVSAAQIIQAREAYAKMEISEEIISGLASAALAFGVWSMRATQFALRAARALAALSGRDYVSEEDAALAVKLVLVPRATQIPQQEQDQPPEQEPEQAPEEEAQPEQGRDSDDDHLSPDSAGDRIVEATQTLLDADLLARLVASNLQHKSKGAGGKSQSAHASRMRGAPM